MRAEDSFYIVAVGLSAGGLSALQELIGSLTETDYKNASFIILAHLPLESNSRLDKMLASQTGLQASWIEPGETPRPNSFHLLPPGYLLTLASGTFHLQHRNKSERINKSIDHFFGSLAREARRRAIGVVLSGTGSDGLTGVKEIEAFGGLVLVQHPATAQFDSMPANVVSKDHPDFIASPKGIADALRCHLEIPPYMGAQSV